MQLIRKRTYHHKPKLQFNGQQQTNNPSSQLLKVNITNIHKKMIEPKSWLKQEQTFSKNINKPVNWQFKKVQQNLDTFFSQFHSRQHPNSRIDINVPSTSKLFTNLNYLKSNQSSFTKSTRDYYNRKKCLSQTLDCHKSKKINFINSRLYLLTATSGRQTPYTLQKKIKYQKYLSQTCRQFSNKYHNYICLYEHDPQQNENKSQIKNQTQRESKQNKLGRILNSRQKQKYITIAHSIRLTDNKSNKIKLNHFGINRNYKSSQSHVRNKLQSQQSNGIKFKQKDQQTNNPSVLWRDSLYSRLISSKNKPSININRSSNKKRVNKKDYFRPWSGAINLEASQQVFRIN